MLFEDKPMQDSSAAANPIDREQPIPLMNIIEQDLDNIDKRI